MECMEEGKRNKMNISSFSQIICEKWSFDSDIITNYIFSNICFSMGKQKDVRKEINKIYSCDQLRYYNAASKSNCINHVIISQGNLEHELYARKALGILIEAEYDSTLRSKLIKILRKYYPIIYNAVKKHDKDKLKNRYIKMDILTRNIEAKFDAAIYLYFAVYISQDKVDQGFIISILNDIEDFEFESSINKDTQKELQNYKDQIQKMKVLIKNEYGKISNYKDIIRNNNEDIRSLGVFLEDLFTLNKININHAFGDFEFINIDKILLSYVRGMKNKDPNLIVSNIISAIFIQSLINEYKNARKLYLENNNEEKQYELNEIEGKFKCIENENKSLKVKIDELSKEKSFYEKNLNNQLNYLNNIHRQEMKKMEERIKGLASKLNDEKNLRMELESLREYELNLDTNIEKTYMNRKIEDYIIDKKIIIIGGDKEWRRRFRFKYPEIRTLNGFNENFDISLLNNGDYIFFYTKYMNHSTFHKAMNYIKLTKCKFGYIGKTNINLVEQEIIENIIKVEIP